MVYSCSVVQLEDLVANVDNDQVLEANGLLVGDDNGELEANKVRSVVGNQPPLGDDFDGRILWFNLHI